MLVVSILNRTPSGEILLANQQRAWRPANAGRALAAQAPISRVERLPHFGAKGGRKGLVRRRLGETFSLRLLADRERDME